MKKLDRKQMAARVARDLPALDLAADEFSYRGKRLGRVEILARHDGPFGNALLTRRKVLAVRRLGFTYSRRQPRNALDVELGPLDHASKAQIERAMKGHVIAHATLMGTYQKGG